jgi:hypothetical protein
MSLRFLSFAVISACAVSVFAATQQSYAVVESHGPPTQWKRLGPAPKDKIFQMKIGLEQEGFGELERELYQGRTPRFASVEAQVSRFDGLTCLLHFISSISKKHSVRPI